MESSHRQPHETMQQWRGRQKRERNAANDALNLQPGEPINNGGRFTRFQPHLIDRMRPVRITRLEGEELAQFLAKEKEREESKARDEQRIQERNAFYERPEVRDADAIRYILEDRLKVVIDRLTPTEWADLRSKLEKS